jgi:hypothetical protein
MTVRSAAVVLAALLLTGGCLGFVTGDEALTFEAEQAVVDEVVAADAGYRSNGTRTVAVNRTFDVAGQSRTVTAKNEVTTYEKVLDLGALGEARLGVFAVVSTPAVTVGDQTLNPIGDYDNDQLVGLIRSEYPGLHDVDPVGSRTITVLGERTEVTKYAAEATVMERRIDVYVHVTKLRHESDFVVAIGLYPRLLDGEEEHILEMMRAIDHPS